MFISVLDLFKIGLGPSSSHTMGPMVAARRFLDQLRASPFQPAALSASLHGSLAFTGKGHATDRATILGLGGVTLDTYDADVAEQVLARIAETGHVEPDGLPSMAFDPDVDLIFDYDRAIDGHANAMELFARDAEGDTVLRQVYFSVGGGFVLTEDELAQGGATDDGAPVPYPFKSADEMMRMCRETGQSIADLKRANELSRMSRAELHDGLARIWDEMAACMDRGLETTGVLPGGLNVRRRAAALAEGLRDEHTNQPQPHQAMDWLAAYAMAVNEENAAGGRVVTAPTNGASGVVPAVIRYWLDHVPGSTRAKVTDFLLTAAAIGGLVKHNASISGAECGCQAEVGSAAAMAAAGLCAVMGGSPEQIENAAEIALEHHLGMTCDPVRGLVQVPCIERNGLGAMKAVGAASLALRGDGTHFVPLDAAIETMRQTGRDMSEKYKETALGGLAVNIPNC
ncbi:L-serine dehydratase 1 [Rhodobacteraceae bacterium THAF1]|uniref:L-serine ammonia-lyase n=1 Tax=Palleronia sp. THAF1 TaxID=2587842 RepID=UPI000F3CB8B2|nr:L-serine ammonia-lyase [Palleronia sp. THAF1]QFU07445.1 L-serine dehydratase 1 [Palleronia sp. THAF1]VDC20643.1 L-serine dehydratase 1 [Rhodobacteraceae bacterium THAF1]